MFRIDQPGDPLGMSRGETHPDRASPVVDDQRQAAVELEVVEQGFEVANPALKRVFIAVIPRLVGRPQPTWSGTITR